MTSTLLAEKRTLLGRAAKTLRQENLIPAELYGNGVPNIHLSVPKKEFLDTYKKAGESSMIDLKIGGEIKKVMIHSISKHPVSEEVTSIDFFEVNLKEAIQVNVPLVFVGEPAGVKEKGGILLKNMIEVEVEALPANLPPEITVDLSSLIDIGSTIYVRDLVIPKDVKIEESPEAAVVSIAAKMTEEEDLASSEEADLSAITAEKEKPEEETASEPKAE